MISYILRRLVLAIPVLIIVGIVVFALVHLAPGDPASVILGPDATPEQVNQLRETMGLNDPLIVQFFNWLGGVVRLDLGESLFLGIPVTEALFNRLQITSLLTLYSLTFSIIIGVPLGIIAAVRANSLL